ncbi:hypothetical protein Aduo_013493 [Ancylostoma duodenale]
MLRRQLASRLASFGLQLSRLLHDPGKKRRMANGRERSEAHRNPQYSARKAEEAFTSRGRASVSRCELAWQLCLVFSIRKLLTAEMRLTTPSRLQPGQDHEIPAELARKCSHATRNTQSGHGGMSAPLERNPFMRKELTDF